MYKLLISFILFIVLHCTAAAQTPWKPGDYAVPEIADCDIFDIAIARVFPSPEIRYCPPKFERLNVDFPGAGHFYFVHEYGHITLRNANEEAVDNWACMQLANIDKGYFFINAFIRHLLMRCYDHEPSTPGYGTPCERAERIIQFTKISNPTLCFDEKLMQFED